MNSSFNITKNGNCGITVTGTDDGYLTNDGTVSTRNYTFAESLTIDAITAVSSEEEETYETSEIVPHTDIDAMNFVFKHDGLYKVTHIIIPGASWLAKVKSLDAESLKLYTSVYYYDTSVGKYYLYDVSTRTSEEVLLPQILEINNTGSTLIRSDSYTFNICYLEECNARMSLSCLEKNHLCPGEPYQYDRFLRDIIFMAINVIKYYLGSELYLQAQNIIERIESCGIICNDIFPSPAEKGGMDCGCSR